MIKYGYWPTVDEKLATAERRLLRLQQMEQDARVILRRRNVELRAANQSGTTPMQEIWRLIDRQNSAIQRLNSVIGAVMEQQTLVRQLRTGAKE